MNICIYLSYSGLGANLMHLAYCHQIAKKYGPVTIITLNNNLKKSLEDDPLIKDIVELNKNYKKLKDILKLSKFLKGFNFDKIFIFYPSLRISIASKIAGIKEIKSYPFYKKKNLHLVNQAKSFTEKVLGIQDCDTETKFFISKNKTDLIKNHFKSENCNVVIGAGSSGPSTKWGSENYSKLINKLNQKNKFFFFILCGKDEDFIAEEIMSKIKNKNCISLSKKNIDEVIPYLSLCDLYVGNDSFGHHVTSQCGIPSIILMLDTPRAYSDYSKNQYRMLPTNAKLDDIKHDSFFPPESINVESVYNKIIQIKNVKRHAS